MANAPTPFLTRVRLRNYKSIRECDVRLGPLMFLVGPNGSGKSNFLDALRFVSDSLNRQFQNAVRDRGGMRGVLWRGEQGRAECFSIELDLAFGDDARASYAIAVTDLNDLHHINVESCSVYRQGELTGRFCVRDGTVTEETTIPTPPRASVRSSYLGRLSGVPAFASVYEFLSGMRFFDIEPQRIRQEASSGKPAQELLRDGTGALYATQQVLGRPKVGERIHEYLRAILPTLRKFDVETDQFHVGPSGGAGHVSFYGRDPDGRSGEPRSLKFVLATENAPYPSLAPSRGLRVFDAQSMSDGTLRAFGILLALFQCVDRPADDPIPLVAIEEPEAALHPAAAGVLFDALHEASHYTQVLVATHSADLLDTKDLAEDSLLVVDMVDGATVIGPADDVSKSIMRDRLCTAGELLRQDQLRPQSQSPGSANVVAD